MDTDTLEQIIDNAIERHGLRVVYNIFTSYDLIPCLVDAHGNYWTEPNLAGYVDGEPFETCLAYLAGDAKKEDLPDESTVYKGLLYVSHDTIPLAVNGALAASAAGYRSPSRTIGTSIVHLLTVLEGDVFGQLRKGWLESAKAVISEIIDDLDEERKENE